MGPDRLARIQNPPKDVREKLQSLELHKQAREELSRRLIEETAQCVRLEQELASYYSSIAPIHDCPTETLLSIFSFYLKENPLLARRLMLVCRRWYGIVVGHARFWTEINIKFDTNAHLLHVIDSSNLYIEACRRNGGHSPVTIELDFSGLGLSSRHGVYSTQWMKSIGRDVLNYSPNRSEYSSPSSHSGTDENEDDPTASKAEEVTSEEPFQGIRATELVKTLLGDFGDVMLRCVSMRLRLPRRSRLAMEIWGALSFDAPLLEALWLFDWSSRPGGFKRLTSLKQLQVQEISDFWFIQGIHEAPLKILSVYTDLGTSIDLNINQFAGLIRLTITSVFGHLFQIGSPTEHLHLPLLRRLDLHGRFTAINRVRFDVPVLQYLYMRNETWYDSERPSLPNITVTNVKWTNLDAYDRWSRHGARNHLASVLNHFGNSETLIMPIVGKKIITSILDELKANGSLPGKWREVVLEEAAKPVEVLDIRKEWQI